MRVVYYIRHLGLTGGTRIAALHAAFLREMGHEAVLAARHLETNYAFPVPVRLVADTKALAALLPEAVVTCKPSDCLEALALKGVKQVFFCQGYDIAQLEEYHARKMREPKYAWWGGRLFLSAKKALQARGIHRVFSLSTRKWVVSPHIADIIRETYGQESRLIRNCYEPERFYPEEKPDGPPRILCVGDYRLARKNIPTALEALRLVKEQREATFIRVSPKSIAKEELVSGVVDEAHEGIPDAELAKLYRTAHVLLSPSTEEGFGLPAIEAMACRTRLVLADIPAYRHFHVPVPDAALPYARHCPAMDAKAMAEAIIQALNDTPENTAMEDNALALAEAYRPEATKADLAEAMADLARKRP